MRRTHDSVTTIALPAHRAGCLRTKVEASTETEEGLYTRRCKVVWVPVVCATSKNPGHNTQRTEAAISQAEVAVPTALTIRAGEVARMDDITEARKTIVKVSGSDGVQRMRRFGRRGGTDSTLGGTYTRATLSPGAVVTGMEPTTETPGYIVIITRVPPPRRTGEEQSALRRRRRRGGRRHWELSLSRDAHQGEPGAAGQRE